MPAHKPPAALWIVILLVIGVALFLRFGMGPGQKAPTEAPPPLSRAAGAPQDPAALLSAAREAIATPNPAALIAALKGLDLNARYPLDGPAQVSLLTFAVTRPDNEVVNTLIKAGAEVDARDSSGKTALMHAARAGSAANVRSLLAANASVAAADADGMTPLHYAAGAGGTAQSVDDLLRAGANADAAGKDGITPLMRAAEAGDHAKCAMLLSAGANPGAKDASGQSALDRATRRADEPGRRCAEFLAQANG